MVKIYIHEFISKYLNVRLIEEDGKHVSLFKNILDSAMMHILYWEIKGQYDIGCLKSFL